MRDFDAPCPRGPVGRAELLVDPEAEAEAIFDGMGTAVCAFDTLDGARLSANKAFDSLFAPAPPRDWPELERQLVLMPAEHLGGCRTFGPLCSCDRLHEASGRWLSPQRTITSYKGARVTLIELTDISARRSSEQRRNLGRERLFVNSQLMSVGEVAATLAHELNQPLGSILNLINGCLSASSERAAGSGELSIALSQARQQCERARDIISRIRDLVGHRIPEFTEVRLGEVVATVLALLDSELRTHQVELRVSVDAALPRVLGDSVMLEQVVHNLMKNAIDALRYQPGQRLVCVSARQTPEYSIDLLVEDNGAGVCAEVVDELFSPFFTTKHDGLGIGLNICRSIMELHRGRLTYLPSKLRGASFKVTVPMSGIEAER